MPGDVLGDSGFCPEYWKYSVLYVSWLRIHSCSSCRWRWSSSAISRWRCIELMREKDMVRRRIRDELCAGGDRVSVPKDPSRSLSTP